MAIALLKQGITAQEGRIKETRPVGERNLSEVISVALIGQSSNRG
jgi:hypothetical protein